MIRPWMKPLALAGLALALSAPAAALAADDTAVTVTGGTLVVSSPAAADFLGVTITGAVQTTTAGLATFDVSDLRGTGAGWQVTAQATQFISASNSLAVGSLQLSEPTVGAQDTTSSTPPSVSAGPFVIDGSAATIASAVSGQGMGVYDFTATTMTLSLPASVYAGSYTSTVTISVVSTP